MISRWKLLVQGAVTFLWATFLPAQSPDLAKAAELVVKRDFASAETLLEKILKATPNSAEALNLRGLVAAEQGNLDGAKDWFDKALQANPKLAGAHVNLGYLYKRQGHPDLALESFQQAAELLPGDPEALLNAAIILADQKHFEEAVRAVSSVPEKQRTGRHWEVLGRLHLTLGDVEQAERDFAQVLEKEPESVETLRILSGLELKQGNAQAAWDYIARARRLAPNSAQILFEFGQISMTANYVRESVLAFRRALMMDDTQPDYYGGLILALLMTVEYPLAEPYVEKYIQLRPDDDWGYYIKGKLLFYCGRQDEAVPFLERATKMDPKSVEPLHYLGRIAADRGDSEQAAQYFRRALECNPDHAPTHLRLGMLHLRLREYDQAESELRRAAQLDPEESTVHLQLGMLLGRTGRPDEAQKEAELFKTLKAAEQKKQDDSMAAAPFSRPSKKQPDN